VKDFLKDNFLRRKTSTGNFQYFEAENNGRIQVGWSSNSGQYFQIWTAQHRTTDGEEARTRKASHVRVPRVRTTFRYLCTVEEYRCTIFFPTPSHHTIVDSPRDFESSIAWCERTVIISLQRVSDSLARTRTPAFLRVRRKETEWMFESI